MQKVRAELVAERLAGLLVGLIERRKPIVLATSLVDLLRLGGYRDVQSEISLLSSDDNRVEVPPDSERLVRSAIFRLNTVDENTT
jgi:hypothetical protein